VALGDVLLVDEQSLWVQKGCAFVEGTTALLAVLQAGEASLVVKPGSELEAYRVEPLNDVLEPSHSLQIGAKVFQRSWRKPAQARSFDLGIGGEVWLGEYQSGIERLWLIRAGMQSHAYLAREGAASSVRVLGPGS